MIIGYRSARIPCDLKENFNGEFDAIFDLLGLWSLQKLVRAIGLIRSQEKKNILIANIFERLKKVTEKPLHAISTNYSEDIYRKHKYCL